ncbi:MAG: hypothetical protein QM496_12100 [Verrucomicrobiota bacterium]
MPTSTTKPDSAVRLYFATIGAKGGKSGTGESKRRSPEHYRIIARKSLTMKRRNAQLSEREKRILSWLPLIVNQARQSYTIPTR